ncbi:SphA family protein [Ferrimonas futtsuensis]|uniref:SphA family protein n=1 Tax=Ferrimonas futtsuensis TaxID=364764 RepID=UPI00146EB6E0|nr:transporter [Ferrimonas futtsuensis]
MKPKWIHLRQLALPMLLAACPNAQATEYGGGAYPNGVEGFMAGALPPPGLYYMNYLNHYSVNRMNDSGGDPLPVEFKLNATSDVSRIAYITDHKLFGANYGIYVVLPLVHLSAEMAMGPTQLSSTDSGLGDIAFSPLVLSWHTPELHFGAALEIVAPVGDFDADRLANIGRNYWTVEPVFAITYLPASGLELSAKFMYDLNFENGDTHYESGDEFHFDYAVGYHRDNWTYGLAGYYYKQVTDDKLNGQTVGDGNRGEAFAVGPAVMYSGQGWSIEARYQAEVMSESRPEGDKLWLKASVAL